MNDGKRRRMNIEQQTQIFVFQEEVQLIRWGYDIFE